MTSATAEGKLRHPKSYYTDAGAAVFGQSRRAARINAQTELKNLEAGKFQVRVASLPSHRRGIANLTKLLRQGTFVCEGEFASVGDTAVFDVPSPAMSGSKMLDQKGTREKSPVEELLAKCARFLTFSRIETPPIRVVEARLTHWLIGFPRKNEKQSGLQGIGSSQDRLSTLTARFLGQLTANSGPSGLSSGGVLQSLAARGAAQLVMDENALFQTISVNGSVPESLVLQSASETAGDAFVIRDDDVAFQIPQVAGVNRNRNRSSSLSTIRTRIRAILPAQDQIAAVRIGVVDSGLSETVARSEFSKLPTFAAFDRESGQRIAHGPGASFHDFLGADSSSGLYSHGTAVAAIVGGRSGIASTCELAVAGMDFSQSVTPTAVQRAIRWLTYEVFGPDGLNILSLSLDVRLLNAKRKGIDGFLASFVKTIESSAFHCFAAVGNSSPPGANHGVAAEPAARAQVNAVGAVDAAGDLAHFSNYCLLGERLFVPEYLALGCEVQTVDAKGRPYRPSGTSFATPIAAGIAALVLQTHSNPRSLEKEDLYDEMLRVGVKKQIGMPPHQGCSVLVPR
jgi:hypothetical protein